MDMSIFSNPARRGEAVRSTFYYRKHFNGNSAALRARKRISAAAAGRSSNRTRALELSWRSALRCWPQWQCGPTAAAGTRVLSSQLERGDSSLWGLAVTSACAGAAASMRPCRRSPLGARLCAHIATAYGHASCSRVARRYRWARACTQWWPGHARLWKELECASSKRPPPHTCPRQSLAIGSTQAHVERVFGKTTVLCCGQHLTHTRYS